MPETAEEILARGDADMVSMARPFLADPDWVRKAAADRSDEINTCIGCNQACLDHTFQHKVASCLVNPRAGARDRAGADADPHGAKRVAVVGAGPAGLAAATAAAERGHHVELFEADGRDRRPVQAGPPHPGQGGVRRDAALLHPAARDHRGQGAARTTASPPPSCRGRVGRDRAGHRRHPARASTSPGPTGANVHSYADVITGEVAVGAAGRRHRRRRHRLRRQRVPHPRRGRPACRSRPRGLAGRVGRRSTRPTAPRRR